MTSQTTQRLYLVEDDEDLRRMLHSFLCDEGFEVESCANHLEFEKLMKTQSPDLVLLDLMLPGRNGIEISQQIRPHYSGPILIITAQENEILEVTALNEGATAYFKKPIRPHLLLAHIKALIRQHGATDYVQPPTTSEQAALEPLIIDEQRHVATLHGQDIELSTAEFELLALLAKHRGRVVSRDLILANVRGIEYDGLNRSIDVRISSLRKKLSDTKPPYKFIKTVRGKGYILAMG